MGSPVSRPLPTQDTAALNSVPLTDILITFNVVSISIS